MNRCVAVLYISLALLLSVYGHGHGDVHHDVPQDGLPPGFKPRLTEFQLNEVILLPGSPEYDGQMLNKQYLHMLDPDRLLRSFLINVNVSTNAEPMGGWESPDSEIRGHFVAMYLSACAKAYNSYGDVELKNTCDYMVATMAKVQVLLNEGGYMSAFPSTTFDRMEAMQQPLPWAPYYVIHKLLQGLYDMHTLAGNNQAYDVLTKMVDYFYNRMQNVVKKYGIFRWQEMLMNSPWTEFGGFNEFMYILYDKTRDPRHLWMAHMFDDGSFLGPLAMDEDWLTNIHANSHIPIVLGAAKRYEIFGEDTYGSMVNNFWRMVYYNHSYATGGSNGGNGSCNATNEHWGWPGYLAKTLTNNNQEFCTQYNILKVVRYLIQWYSDPVHMDHYERAYINGILGTQKADAGPGVMLYNYPLQTGLTKAQGRFGWGTPWGSFWCCYATAVEQWSKMGDSIYFQSASENAVYVNLYVASTLTWTRMGVRINQTTSFPIEPSTKLTVTIPSGSPVSFSLYLRIPYWIQPGGTLLLNGQPYPAALTPQTLVGMSRAWQSGDTVELTMPMALHAVPMPDDANLIAVMYGPVVLAGIANVTHLLPPGSASRLSSFISRVPPGPSPSLEFTALVDAGRTNMTMLPVYDILNQPYGVYWPVATN